MKVSDIVDVKPVKSFGKRTGEYVATFVGASFKGSGKNQVDAIENVIKAAREHLAHRFHRKYLHAKDGTVFALYYAGAWSYDIVRPTGHSSAHTLVQIVKDHIAQYDE